MMSIHENMEKLLMVWLMEKQLAGDTVTKAIICEKARAIYADLLQQTPGTLMDEALGEPFKASQGWFENFKKRTAHFSYLKTCNKKMRCFLGVRNGLMAFQFISMGKIDLTYK
uniref:HTH CENPB-type domain-containing protein n=1 Tax=Pelusios castaneus TaxID=367368 RepID=A0A8C8S8U6_9SAUR